MRLLIQICVCLALLAGGHLAPAQAQSAPVAETVGSGSKPVGALSQSPLATRLTIAVIGDSLGDGLWEGLHRHLRSDKRLAVARGAKHSVGFTVSDMTEQIDQAFAGGTIDALVVMIGANDDRRSIFVDGKSVALFGTPKWIALYRERVENFMDHATKRQVPLI
jgi:hypothetical protein